MRGLLHPRLVLLGTTLVLGLGLAHAQGLPELSGGTTLPVSLETALSAKHVRVGERITARLSQRVPLGGGYLPAKARILGSIAAYDGHSLSLRFNTLRLGDKTEPLEVRLVAAAFWMDVGQTRDPLDGGDRGTSSPADWTTQQIGRDEVYRSGGSGTVYNQFSEPVGHADTEGVYAAPVAGVPAHAMGPFSTTASGLYDLQDLRLISAGGSGMPIVLGLNGPKWKLDTATALLLEVVGK
jgi:hypothetical protein